MSKDRDFQFTYSFVRVVYEPHDEIITAYLEVIARYQAENTVVIEPDMSEVVVSQNPAESGDDSGIPGAASPTNLAHQPDMPSMEGDQTFEMNTPE